MPYTYRATVAGMPIERRGPDTLSGRGQCWRRGGRTTWRAIPVCSVWTPNCSAAAYHDGLCKRCWHAQAGRNQAADGAGDGASRSQDLNEQPSPAPETCPECGKPAQVSVCGCDVCATLPTGTCCPADMDPTRCLCDPTAGLLRPAAPSLPMDLCSDIPERCGLCGALLAEVDAGLASTSCVNCRGERPEDDQ